jgi:thiosulfate/3-mercaptopyruvate sulfurtransferase
LPLETAVRSPEPRTIETREQLGAWLSSSQVDALRVSPGSLLVDARGAERFAGRNETIDQKAGHVPGARNRPFLENLGADGRFLPADELRRRWTTLLGALPPSAVVAMCGSGVTACQNLLALEHAGLSGGRLYAGSWSEWIRDPNRPIATGSY